MGKRNEKLLVVLVALSAVAFLINHLLWTQFQSVLVPALHPYLALTALLCLALWARLRFARLAEDERRDQTQARDAASPSLFQTDENEIDPVSFIFAQRQYEKWFIPFLAPVLAVIFGYWSYRLFQSGFPLDEATNLLFVASLLIGQAFVFFLFGRYFLGLSRATSDRLLRGPGNIILLTALAIALAGVAAIITELGYALPERILRLVLIGYLAWLSIEWLINTIGYLYRPKRKDEQVVTYESRITALLTDPQSWANNIAQALDYQFGFGVSETGFYRFLQRVLLPLIVVQVLLLYALSTVVVLGPEEEAIKERFGNPLAPDGTPRHLTSGLHFKWPWPFETVRRHPARRILTTHVGFTKDPNNPHPRLIVWTQPHYLEEDQFIVAQRDVNQADLEDDAAVPVNFVTVNVPIEYRVTDLYRYLYRHNDPDGMLQMAAHRVITRELARRDLIELLGDERQEAGRRLFEALQERVRDLELGIDIVFMGLHGAHPPIPVGPAFESVIGSFEERETSILQARAYRNRILPLAQAEGDELIWMARADRARRADRASAEADWFQTRRRLHEDLPGIYTPRLYLDTVQRALAPVRKYIVATSPDLEVLIFNLEEKLRPDLFDFGPGRSEDMFL